MAWSRSRSSAPTWATALLGVALVGACRAPSGLELPDGSSFTRPVELDVRLRAADLRRDALGIDGAALFGAPGSDVQQLFAEAAELAAATPDWIAPARLVDDLDRAALCGPAAWARRAAAWQATGAGADAYLLGRLETPARAAELFGAARDRSPDLAWGFHGTAFSLQASGADWRTVDGLSARALPRAASLHELLVLGTGRARFLANAGQRDAAEHLAADLAALPGLLPAERAELEAFALISDLRHGSLGLGDPEGDQDEDEDEGGSELRRAMALLAPDSGLMDHLVPGLVAAVDSAVLLGRTRTDRLRALIGALEPRVLAGRDPALESLLGRLVSELDRRYRTPEMLPGARPTRALDAADRTAAAAFAAGDLRAWLDTWRGNLPARVLALSTPLLDFDGSRLESPAGRRELLEILVYSGWFEAARALVARSGELGLLADLELEPKPLPPNPSPQEQEAAMARLWESFEADSVERYGRSSDAGSSLLSELGSLVDLRLEDGDLARLLGDIEGIVADFGRPLFDRAGYRGVDDGIPDSRLDTYGPFASLVTPTDEQGAAPAGLQSMLGLLGRTAILGEQFGTLDGTIRPLVARERLEGEHLGTPFGGTALWCEGVDVQSRAERAGAGIAGAAVHDGYWIDLEVVRAGAVAWAERAERLAPIVAELMAGRQLPAAPLLLDAGDAGEATRRVPLLGEGERLGLMLLADRGGAAPTLDELFELVCIHEEGHLCDRTRFLPIAEKWGPGLRFFAGCNFSPAVMLRRLEYRAQLTALCELDEPRLVLWEVLEMAEATEANGSGPTPHGAAYVELLDDLVDLIGEWGPGEVGLDPGRYLRWQLHRLGGDELRRLGLELARREGLVDDPALLSAL